MRLYLILGLTFTGVLSCKTSSNSLVSSRNGTPTSNDRVFFVDGVSAGSAVAIGSRGLLSVNHVLAEDNYDRAKVYPNFSRRNPSSAQKVGKAYTVDTDFRRELTYAIVEGNQHQGYPIWTGSYDRLRDANVYALGYGVDGTGSHSAGTLRKARLRYKGVCQVPKAFENKAQCYDSESQLDATDLSAIMLEFLPGGANELPCQGDSGGPVLADIDGKTYVVSLSAHLTVPDHFDFSASQNLCENADGIRAVAVKYYTQFVQNRSEGDRIVFSHGVFEGNGNPEPSSTDGEKDENDGVSEQPSRKFFNSEYHLKAKIKNKRIDTNTGEQLCRNTVDTVECYPMTIGDEVSLVFGGFRQVGEAFTAADQLKSALAAAGADAFISPTQLRFDCSGLSFQQQSSVTYVVCQ